MAKPVGKSLEEHVKDLVADQLVLAVQGISSNMRFREDLGADSLDAVELVMRLEEEFEMNIDDESADNFKTVGDVIVFLQEAGKE